MPEIFPPPVQTVKSHFHKKMEEGVIYFASHEEAALADAASHRIKITTPATPRVELIFSVTGTLSSKVEFYENPNTPVGGTGITEFNMDRDSGNTADCAVTEGDTVTGEGTQLFVDNVGAEAKKEGFGGSSAIETPVRLKASEEYILKVTNTSGTGPADYVLRFVWMESND